MDYMGFLILFQSNSCLNALQFCITCILKFILLNPALWLCVLMLRYFWGKKCLYLFEVCWNQNLEVFLCTVARSGGSSDDQLLKVLLKFGGWHQSSPAFKLPDLKPSACDENGNVIGFPPRGGTTRIEIMMKKKNHLVNTVGKYNWEIQLRNTVEDDDEISDWLSPWR